MNLNALEGQELRKLLGVFSFSEIERYLIQVLLVADQWSIEDLEIELHSVFGRQSILQGLDSLLQKNVIVKILPTSENVGSVNYSLLLVELKRYLIRNLLPTQDPPPQSSKEFRVEEKERNFSLLLDAIQSYIEKARLRDAERKLSPNFQDLVDQISEILNASMKMKQERLRVFLPQKNLSFLSQEMLFYIAKSTANHDERFSLNERAGESQGGTSKPSHELKSSPNSKDLYVPQSHTEENVENLKIKTLSLENVLKDAQFKLPASFSELEGSQLVKQLLGKVPPKKNVPSAEKSDLMDLDEGNVMDSSEDEVQGAAKPTEKGEKTTSQSEPSKRNANHEPSKSGSVRSSLNFDVVGLYSAKLSDPQEASSKYADLQAYYFNNFDLIFTDFLVGGDLISNAVLNDYLIDESEISIQNHTLPLIKIRMKIHDSHFVEGCGVFISLSEFSRTYFFIWASSKDILLSLLKKIL